MSLPDEKVRALKNARDLLFELASGYKRPSSEKLLKKWDKSDFKRVPKDVRNACQMVMRHYPFAFEIDMFWKDSSDRNPPPVNRKPAVRQPRRGQNYPRKGAISTSQSKRSPGSYPPAAARPQKPRNADLKRGGGKA